MGTCNHTICQKLAAHSLPAAHIAEVRSLVRRLHCAFSLGMCLPLTEASYDKGLDLAAGCATAAVDLQQDISLKSACQICAHTRENRPARPGTMSSVRMP